MKYLVVSDIHGSLFYTKKLIEIIKKEDPDNIIILGDIYYGSNVSNEDKLEIANMLNQYKNKILCTKGNCDSVEDEKISEFTFENKIIIDIHGVEFFFSHGDRYNIDHLPVVGDVVIYGHFHTGYISKIIDGVICANPGSISLPRSNTAHSYMIIDDKEIILKNIDGRLLDRTPYL